MFKIALEIEKNMEILLREYFEYEFINTQEYTFEKINSENFDIAIIDYSIKDLELRLLEFKTYKIKVILLATIFDILTLRYLLNKQLIYDFLNKKDYTHIEEIVQNMTIKENIETEISLCINDNFNKTIVSLEEVLYISYSRYIRKSLIKLDNNKEVFSKKNLVEIENLLSLSSRFVRIDRSNIVNIKRIKTVNYKKELITFDTGESLQFSKKILKKIESILFKFKKIINL